MVDNDALITLMTPISTANIVKEDIPACKVIWWMLQAQTVWNEWICNEHKIIGPGMEQGGIRRVLKTLAPSSPF